MKYSSKIFFFLAFTALIGVTIISLENNNGETFYKIVINNLASFQDFAANDKDVEHIRKVEHCNNINIHKLESPDEFYSYLFQGKSAFCENLKMFGGRSKKKTKNNYIDGAKGVCMDSIYQLNPKKCIVLSFGISNDWSFDDAMGEHGCQVYSFDPTIKKEDHQRSENIKFYHLGISDKKSYIRNKADFKVDRYENILRMLDLEYSIIDYMKIDVEGSELEFFNDVFSKNSNLLLNIKQIGMELHPGKSLKRINQFWEALKKMECFGFNLAFVERNVAGKNTFEYKGKTESQCYEVLWVNSKF